MITLKKQKDHEHKITNERGTESIATSSRYPVDGFSPVDYLCSSVGICMGLTVDAIIERDQLEIDGYTIEVSATKDADARPSRMERLDVSIVFEGDVDEKTRNKLEKSAKRGCTIGNTIEHGVPVNLITKS